MTVSPNRIAKHLLGLALGSVPGVLAWRLLDYPPGFVAFIWIVGAFIGLMLTWPGVSATRVMAGTAAAIVANNLPIGEDKVYNAIAHCEEGLAYPPVPSRASSLFLFFAVGLVLAGLLALVFLL